MITCASTPNTAPDVTRVAVGILQDRHNRVLVTQRHPDRHLGGKWEFPGGKIEPGEPVLAALVRELREELGIHVRAAQPLRRVHHAYPEKTVLLDVWRVTDYSGEPRGHEGQPLRWVPAGQLSELDLPEADRPILRALQLPLLYLISAAVRLGEAVFLSRLGLALQAGARLVQLREPLLGEGDFRRLAKRVVPLVHARGARILLNADPSLVAECHADGVHLNARRLMQLQARPLPEEYLVGASCHDADELVQAGRIGADFAVLSPVRETASHPGAAGLGWEGFAQLRLQADIPVYALGGMLPGHLREAEAAGACGLAMIRGIWDAASIPDAVQSLRR